MDLGIAGRTALVLGGGGGLGRAIAMSLAAEGVSIAVADIDQSAIDATRQVLQGFDVRSMGLAWDISDLQLADGKVAEIESTLGPVDILIGLTGGPPPTTASGQEPDLWSKHFNAMVLSIIRIADRVLPGMRQRRWGRLITSTSSGVITPIPSLAISNALRLSLVGWSKTLAKEVARDGITTNIIVPGRIATERIQFLDRAKAQREGRTVEEVAAESTASIPLGRYGQPQEYGDAVAFLASERATYITGSVLRVDGGLIASI